MENELRHAESLATELEGGWLLLEADLSSVLNQTVAVELLRQTTSPK